MQIIIKKENYEAVEKLKKIYDENTSSKAINRLIKETYQDDSIKDRRKLKNTLKDLKTFKQNMLKLYKIIE